MSSKILMPALSPTMTDGIINQWLVKVGDTVKAGDIIAEIETDKATMEVEAVDEGKITHILEDTANKQIPVNSVIAIIDGDESETIENKKKIENTSEDKKDEEIEKPKQFLDAKISQNSKSQNSDDRLKASPLVKKIAKENNLDLSKFYGTGPDGRIIKRDIVSNNISEEIQNTPFDGDISIPSTMRKVIAMRTLEAKQQIPHFYLTVESNVDKLINLRKKINENNSIKVSFNDLIVKAISLAMKKNPNTNVYWQNDKIYKLNDIDISVAVAIDEGLITPIIKNADSKGLNIISGEIRELAKLAKTNSLTPEQYTGGSITVSNLGMFGISEFAAIISPPQSSILAVGKIIKKPIVVDDEVIVGNTLKSTLSADHRVLDGAVAGKLLKDFNDIIEDPFEIWVKSSDMEIL
ncbi:2-oxo acid dehydrogenase subunit E2 [Alphaproteobacteria bacterium]|nr:dihydrolipoamide acetyltransferase family protein [Alphaproteobacteria bacterium]MDC3270261.1 2-oxo acid dehydrogenase subunit E2 [Alphaproteobacteria bacterium]